VTHVLRFFTTNWKLKLLAVTLAVLLWVVQRADQTVTQWVQVPVEVVLRTGEHAVVSGPVPERVQVRFAGPGREFWELAFNPARLRLVITEAAPDAEYFNITPQMVEGAGGLVAQDVRPGRVRMELRALARRDVPVRLEVGPEVGRDVSLVGPVDITPEAVSVSGTARALAELDAVPTLPLRLGPGDTVFVRTLPIDRERIGGLGVEPAEVEVAGRVQPIVDAEVANVPVALPDGWTASPASVTVSVRGPRSLLEDLRVAELRVVVPSDSMPDAETGRAAAPLRAEGLPTGVTARIDPDRVMVMPERPPEAEVPEPQPEIVAPPNDGG
jgi:YbbR domain-containing protein